MKNFLWGMLTGALILFSLLAVIAVNSAHACENVQRIELNAPAPCPGWLVKDSTMQEIVKEKKELIEVRKQNITLKELGSVNDEIIGFHKTRAKDLEKSLRWEESKSNWKMIGGFVLGIVATSLTVYSVNQASK